MSADPQIAALLQAYAANSRVPRDAEGLRGYTIHDLRAEMARMAGPPPVIEGTRDIGVPHPDGHKIPVRLHAAPDRKAGSPIVIYLHGGGWATGGNDSHGATAQGLARDTGFLVAAVDYRLAPEHPFPAGLEDCWAALQWIAAHADELGADGDRIALVGDSAGATFATVLAMMARDAGGPGIAGQVLVYPATDTDLSRWPSMAENSGYLLSAASMAWYYDLYVDAAHRADPRVAPIRSPDLSGLPPAFVATAELDILRDEGEAYAAKLRAAGTPVTLTRYAGQVHGFYRLPDSFDVARQVRAEVATFLRQALTTRD